LATFNHMKQHMNTPVLWGITKLELLLVVLVYTISAFAYNIAIWLNMSQFSDGSNAFNLFSLTNFIDNSGLQYTIFFLFTIPIWWLVFIRLKKKPITLKIVVHLIALPIFVLGSKQVYYSLSDALGFSHLTGSGEVWDIYIPALIYTIQFSIFHAYAYFKENQIRLKTEGELKQAALKSELAAIKAQLNPHFLYNVFNTINASVPPQQEKTRQMIATLADLFRYQLKASKKELVSLSEELDFVNKYLELEKARFEDRLQIDINVADGLMTEKIPPMLLQPLVENSIKHGIANELDGGKITISIFKEKDRLQFEIADTGTGVEDKTSLFGKGIGLSNTRLRLEKMYQSQLEILDNQPQGLKIRFAI